MDLTCWPTSNRIPLPMNWTSAMPCLDRLFPVRRLVEIGYDVISQEKTSGLAAER